MPTTVNGIGTHYFGKRDLVSRAGTCQHCGAQTELKSYTTRLWFVVLFIPIFPLKRVRLLDFCPKCSRHWVANPEQYEMSRQLAVSGAMDAYRERPSVENALLVHAQFLSYHMHSEADQFRESVLSQFRGKAELLAGLASHLEQAGRWQEATPLYEEAFQIDPGLPEVRSALAWRKGDTNLDEAYALLDFLRQPGAGQSYNLGQLESLAQAYQKRGDHDRALELFAILLREFPEAGNRYEFRKAVQKTERALGRTQSLLPDQSFSVSGLFDSRSGTHSPAVRWTVFSTIAALLFCGGMYWLNQHYRSNRELFVLNAFAQPMTVSLDGGPAIPVGSRLKLELSEGTHSLQIEGPISCRADITLAANFWTRWTYKPAWIFNVAGASPVSITTLKYAAVPEPSRSEWLDQEMNFVPHVDYLFETPPDTLPVEGRNKVVTKVHVGIAPSTPANLLIGMLSEPGRDPEIVMTFAEGHLEKSPTDLSLLTMYCRPTDVVMEKRVVEFLKAGLWRRPVSVNWHRAYQNLATVVGTEPQLAAEYDAQIQQHPDDAVLLYLRGRVGPTREDQLSYFRRALDVDPGLGWPQMALAYDAANRGDWAEANTLCSQATSLHGDLSFREFWHVVRLARGEAAQLEEEYRKQFSGQDVPQIMSSLYFLIDAMAAQQKGDQMVPMVRQCMATFVGGDLDRVVASFQPLMDYTAGRLDAFRNVPEPRASGSEFLFHGLVAVGDVDRAAAMEGVDESHDWTHPMSLYVACDLAGQREKAIPFLKRAVERLKAGDADQKRAASLFSRNEPPTGQELDDITLKINDTPLMLVALARQFPDHRGVLSERARKLNVSRLPPYLLIQRAIEASAP